jgi:hypothetical protein
MNGGLFFVWPGCSGSCPRPAMAAQRRDSLHTVLLNYRSNSKGHGRHATVQEVIHSITSLNHSLEPVLITLDVLYEQGSSFLLAGRVATNVPLQQVDYCVAIVPEGAERRKADVLGVVQDIDEVIAGFRVIGPT